MIQESPLLEVTGMVKRFDLRRSFRNWFQPHYQYVYAGFRCAAD